MRKTMTKTFILLLIRVLYFFKIKLGIRIPGLGRAQKMLKTSFQFKVNNKLYHYDPSIEGSYDFLLIGKSNEPETHLFLKRVVPGLHLTNFIDVGASVGEFVLGISNYPNVQKIFAFEPRPDCAEVLQRNLDLNKEDRGTLFRNAASDKNGSITMHLNPGGTSSGIYAHNGSSKRTIEISAIILDDALPEYLENPIMLIDVEGAEPLVLKGGKLFIANNRPLIIFEFNTTSKEFFTLEDIQNILGGNYTVYRLKSDGNLDREFSNSWNCVAVPGNSVFSDILFPLETALQPVFVPDTGTFFVENLLKKSSSQLPGLLRIVP